MPELTRSGPLPASFAKRLARRLFEDYRINWILASPAGHTPAMAIPPVLSLKPVDPLVREALRGSNTAKVRNALTFAEAGLEGLALYAGETMVSVAHFALPGQYGHASTWPLGEKEAALVDIATEEAARGQGYAAHLIRASVSSYRARGMRRLIAFIWWSNDPSLRAFRKSGWRRIGLSLELRIGGRWISLRIPLAPAPE